jgi:hypothetical protein
MSTPTFTSTWLIFSLLAIRLGANTPDVTARGGAPVDPAPPRHVSPQISSALSAGISFQPSAGPGPKIELESSPPAIIQLPEHVVEGERSLSLSDREVHAPADLLKLSRRRYLSEFHGTVLNRFRIGGGEDAYALQRFTDDERLQNIATFNDKLSVYRAAGDPAATKQLEREIRWTFLRRGAF